MTKSSYGIKVSTILNATDRLSADLDYLCSIVEDPDPEFPIANALIYARAVTAICNQLDFFIEDLSENNLSEDQEYVKVSEEEVLMMNTFNEGTEAALFVLEKVCGISLQNN
jgi:hypothetical protein